MTWFSICVKLVPYVIIESHNINLKISDVGNQSHLNFLDMEAIKPYGTVGDTDVREEESIHVLRTRISDLNYQKH